MYLYAVRDNLAQESGPIFTGKTDQVAIRGARQMLSAHGVGADFVLYCLGEYDSEKGVITALDNPRLVSSDLEVRLN